MHLSLAFTRIFFFILSIFFMTTYMVSIKDGFTVANALIGIGIGTIFSLILFGFDRLFRRFNLRAFNIAIIGIFIGYLMGEALTLTFDAILDISKGSIVLSPQIIEIIKIALFLFGIYLGTLMTIRASDEFYVSIPFVKFSAATQKKKDLLIDQSFLSDARVIDFLSSGLLDHHLILPRFIIKDLYVQAESASESAKAKAKRCLETLSKLEENTDLHIRFNDTDFPEIKDSLSKMVRLARLLDANILSADISRIKTSSIEGIKIININSISNALKPLMQTGEKMTIKIQRYGKEPRQGVGYLEDGTMVVVNGGGDFIGENVDAFVL
ncbi:MAG TPA: TRAM domain-containing protein, partial [Chlamydiales bacterium]|nr:TRAM domain-containing protein [Chlamydiales bacterium]